MILTVTMNPAVDEEYFLSEFHAGSWFRANKVVRSAGGKGINVSVILAQLGYESAAMGFLAGYNGEYIRDELRKHQITTNFVHVPGETRTNVFIVDQTGNLETGIAEPGPYVSEEALERFLINYKRMLGRANFVFIGGSLPPGVPQDIYRELVKLAKEGGNEVFVDAAGVTLAAALDAKPTFAKIDRRYVSRVSSTPFVSLDSIIDLFNEAHAQGVTCCLTSYRSYGEVFSLPGGVYLAEIEREGVVSMLGAGEALMAGFIVGKKEDMSEEECVRFAMACAYEDSSHAEHGVRNRKAVENFMNTVRVKRLQ
jgi:1-phosphofructokinase family hexose kinase